MEDLVYNEIDPQFWTHLAVDDPKFLFTKIVIEHLKRLATEGYTIEEILESLFDESHPDHDVPEIGDCSLAGFINVALDVTALKQDLGKALLGKLLPQANKKKDIYEIIDEFLLETKRSEKLNIKMNFTTKEHRVSLTSRKPARSSRKRSHVYRQETGLPEHSTVHSTSRCEVKRLKVLRGK